MLTYRYFFLFSLLLNLNIGATEFSPWLGKDFEIETRTQCLYQSYHRVDVGHGHRRLNSNDYFYNFSASLSAFDYSAELETTIADSHHQHPACDNVRLTGRYRVMDDIMDEDLVTITPGFTLVQAFNHSLDDISSFHHGKFEGELHIAIGKEISCEAFWVKRTWALFALGCGDHGSPWIRGNFYYERNWWDRQQLRWFLHTLWGCGNNNLARLEHFRGYGSIRHQSIDLGVRYSYLFDSGLTFSLQYERRLYAKNFPEQVNLLTANIFYSFGI